jgi:uncharacterized protein with NRDE domain
MCLIAWNWQPGSTLPLLVLANRDEFYARPTRALHAWPCGQVLAGKDEQAGGTWLGLGHNASGIRFAAITNFRDVSQLRPDAQSRGELVPEFLPVIGSTEFCLKYPFAVASATAFFAASINSIWSKPFGALT